jgi:hypothetical protein
MQELRMRDNANTELGWPAVAFLLAITVFGVALIGHAPKWPIYVTVLAWWGFVIMRSFMSPDARFEANE